MNGFGELTEVLREFTINIVIYVSNKWFCGINRDIGYIGGLRAGGW